MTDVRQGLRAAGVLFVIAVAFWAFIEREQDRTNKWRDKWRAMSAESSSLSSQFDDLSSSGASAQSSTLAAASSAQASLSKLNQRSKVIRAEIVRQAAADPALNRPLSPSLRNGLRSVYERVCSEAEARSQDGVCTRQGPDASGGEGTVPDTKP